MAKTLTKVIGYVRVSRVGGRSGESFISPGEQRKAIQALAERKGLKVIEWLEELDASGADAKRPMWLQAIGSVERREVAGIAVWNLKRFSRSLKDALIQLERVESVGGTLYSSTEDFDATSTSGRTARNMTFVMAQDELERSRESFAASRANAIERGVYISPKVPFGYSKNAEKRLEPNGSAPIVAELFERKAAGESMTTLAEYSREHDGPGRSGLGDLLKNVAYLGVARSGECVNESAHEPLVSRELFDRAQAARGLRPNRTGVLADAMLKSLLRCSSCGTAMCSNSDRGKTLQDGTREKVAAYTCNNRTTKNADCAATAHIRQAELHAFVSEWVIEHFEGVEGDATIETAADLDDARKRLEDAEQAYSRVRTDVSFREDDYDGWRETLSDCKARVEMTREEVATLKNQTTSVEGFEGSMVAAWSTLSADVQRMLLHGFIKEIRITPANGKHGIPVADRVSIIGVDGTLLNHREEAAHVRV
jgi:site-specific DNA recombinase